MSDVPGKARWDQSTRSWRRAWRTMLSYFGKQDAPTKLMIWSPAPTRSGRSTLRKIRWSEGMRCPLLAISRHPEGSSRTSALPPKADIQIMIPGQAPADVRLAPNSGHKWLWRWMSAYDPKRTLECSAPPCRSDLCRSPAPPGRPNPIFANSDGLDRPPLSLGCGKDIFLR